MRRELENNKRRKESAGLYYLGNTCRDKQPGGSNKQKERERKRGWDLRGGKKGNRTAAMAEELDTTKPR
jgi:hypothetical protein